METNPGGQDARVSDAMDGAATLSAAKDDARPHKFFLMGEVIKGSRQYSWFFMANALALVLTTDKLGAVSRWARNTKLDTQFIDRVNVRAWVTPGVRNNLEKYQRRAVWIGAALTSMSRVVSPRSPGRGGGELFPPTEGEHDEHSEDSDSGSTLSQEHSEALYAQRMRYTAAATTYATSMANLKGT